VVSLIRSGQAGHLAFAKLWLASLQSGLQLQLPLLPVAEIA